MRRLYILAALFCTICGSAAAQPGWSMGDRAAFGHSWTVGNRGDGFERKFHPAFELGRMAIYHFNDGVGLGFGTYFSSQGTRYAIEDETEAILRSNYLKIPVYASFTFGDPGARIRPRITAGPSVQFLVGGKTFLRDTEADAFGGAYTTKAMNTKIDAGANVSLGFHIKVCEGFFIHHDINYYHGFVEQQPNNAATAPSFTNRGLMLGMGMQIDGKALRKWKESMRMHHGNK